MSSSSFLTRARVPLACHRSLVRFAPIVPVGVRCVTGGAGSVSTGSASSGAYIARQQSAFPEHRIGVSSSGAKVERPISPHVTIYSQPIPAISSITNRVTGVLLTIGVSAMGLTALSGSCDIPAYVAAFQHSAPALVPVARAVVAWPLIYHTLAGVRHLYWDYTAKGMDLATVEMSSKLLIATSVVLAIAAAFVSLPTATTVRPAR